MPLRPNDFRQLATGDFRATRAYLADHVFAVRSRRKERPDDLIDEEAWDGQFALPTDVLLRTTTKQGRLASDMYDQWGAWVSATPFEPDESEFMFTPAVDAADEFHASPFIAAHGWYRQATAALRNALETMVLAAAFAVRADKSGFAKWRGNAGEPPRFGNMVDILANDVQLAGFDIKLGLPGLFVRNPPGVVQDIYGNLCRFAHSRPGHTNVDIWQSNGPIYVPRAFTQFWIDFCDTIALCYVLLKIGWPALRLPDSARPLYGAASPRWHKVASKVAADFFPS